jgi:hypothetical protein
MNKVFSPTLAALLLTLWCAGSWYFYTCSMRAACTSAHPPAVTVLSTHALVQPPSLLPPSSKTLITPRVTTKPSVTIPSSPQVCEPYLITNISLHSKQFSADVARLERYLTVVGGIPVALDGSFSASDATALATYQKKHPKSLSYTVSKVKGKKKTVALYGSVLGTTRAFINGHVCYLLRTQPTIAQQLFIETKY